MCLLGVLWGQATNLRETKNPWRKFVTEKVVAMETRFSLQVSRTRRRCWRRRTESRSRTKRRPRGSSTSSQRSSSKVCPSHATPGDVPVQGPVGIHACGDLFSSTGRVAGGMASSLRQHRARKMTTLKRGVVKGPDSA